MSRMKTRMVAISLALPVFALSAAAALRHEDLSDEARALVPKGAVAVIELKDGTRLQGTVTMETHDQVALRVQQTDTIFATRRIFRSDIREMKSADVTPFFAAELLKFETETAASRTAEEYRRILRLFDEFLEKAKGAEQYDEIQRRRNAFGEELAKVSSGMERVGDDWLPPVSASIRNFEQFTEQMDTLRKRKDFRTNEKVQDFYNGLVDQRREVARQVPQLMQDRLPTLLDEQNFDEAAFEVTAFLQFWIAQVVRTEGPAHEVLSKMDFHFILRMMERTMEAYRRAERGADIPADAPKRDEMVYIPGGYFLMGERGADPKRDTFPMRLVYVSPFLIDKYQVTNEEYRKFVDHVKATGESWFQHPDAPPLKKHDARGWAHSHLSRDRQPVIGVDWFDAFAYARWALGRQDFERGRMKRLPTEAEWEKAARGMDARTYPWGEENPDRVMVNWPEFRRIVGQEMDRQNPPRHPEPPKRFGCGGCVKKADLPPPPPTVIPNETWDVDQLLPNRALQAKAKELFEPPWKERDVSPYGVYHMSGNAAEWVYDYYDPEYYWTSPIKDPQGPEKTEDRKKRQVRVYRGGSYLDARQNLSVFRRGNPRNAALQAGCRPGRRRGEIGAPFIGFRCAMSIELVQPADLDRKTAVPDITFEELMRQLQEQDEKTGRRRGRR